jgi:hypothetical protein
VNGRKEEAMIEHPAGLVSAFADRMRETHQKAASDADDQATRFRRNTARFSDTSPVSFLLSLALPLAVYFTGWYLRPLWFTSDATLIFVGSSLVLAAPPDASSWLSPGSLLR